MLGYNCNQVVDLVCIVVFPAELHTSASCDYQLESIIKVQCIVIDIVINSIQSNQLLDYSGLYKLLHKGGGGFLVDPVRSKSLKVGNSSFSCVSLQKLSKIFKSLGFGLSLETLSIFGGFRFQKSWFRKKVLVMENLVSEKSLGFVKFDIEKSLGYGLENLVEEKKLRKIWSWKIWSRKKVSGLVKILVSSFSCKGSYSVTGGFGPFPKKDVKKLLFDNWRAKF